MHIHSEKGADMTRLKDLIAKFVSVKGSVFITACVMLYLGKIDQTMWLGVAALFIGSRAYEKVKGIK